MKTATAVSYEIDDAARAAEELVSGIREKLTIEKNACGIVYGDADCDLAELTGRISKTLGIDVVGSSAMAMIEKDEKYVDMGIVLTVMTAEDAEFSVGVAEALQAQGYREKIREAYLSAKKVMGNNDPKVVFLFAPLLFDLSAENMIDALDGVTGRIPLFGGVASDPFEMKRQVTCRNGQSASDALVMILVGGAVRPALAVQHSFSTPRSANGIITKSRDNVIERVDERSFTEFLEEFGYQPVDGYVHMQYLGTPFLVNFRGDAADNVPVIRDLAHIHLAEGEGVMMGKAPEDAILSIGMMDRENLKESCGGALNKLRAEMDAAPDYEFSLIFVCSCAGRNLLMADSKDLEANILIDCVGEENKKGNALSCMAFYAFGEICPTSVTDGCGINRLHNCSFVACAI